MIMVRCVKKMKCLFSGAKGNEKIDLVNVQQGTKNNYR